MSNEFYNINIERTVLSSIIHTPEIIKITKVDQKDFYLPFHRRLFETLLEMQQKNIPFEESLIKSVMEKKEVFDEVAMLEILSVYPSPVIKQFEDVLFEYSKKRDIFDELNRLSGNIHFQEASEIIGALELFCENQNKNTKDSLLEIKNVNDIEDKSIEFILEQWLPFPIGSVSFLSAPGGTGKTWLALQIALRFLEEYKHESVFLWLTEDPLYESKKRAREISIEFFEKDLFDFNALDMSDSPPFFVINKKNNSTLTTNPLFYSLKQRLKKYKLVILDPFLGFYGGDENNNSDAKFFMNHFQIWAKEEDKVIIFLTHSTKKEKKTRGAGALTDACRLVYEVELIDENKSLSERQIRVSKDNYGVIKILNQDTITRQILPKQKKRLTQQIKFDANF